MPSMDHDLEQLYLAASQVGTQGVRDLILEIHSLRTHMAKNPHLWRAWRGRDLRDYVLIGEHKQADDRVPMLPLPVRDRS